MTGIAAGFRVLMHDGIRVVRDDQIAGGTKARFLPHLIGNARHIIYGGTYAGGAPLALAVIGKELRRRISLFYAARKELSPRQRMAEDYGARLHFVRPGYLSNVLAKARAFADETYGLFLPPGFDVPAARDPFIESLQGLRRTLGSPDEIWCATGSGMLAGCLGEAFPDSHVIGVAVGLASVNQERQFPVNVTIRECELDYYERAAGPDWACAYYERKAWAALLAARKPGRSYLFWNVLGDHA